MAIENMGRYGISRRFAMGFAKKKPGIPGPTKKKQSGDLNDFGGGHRAPLMVN